jgi:hypothetical protein
MQVAEPDERELIDFGEDRSDQESLTSGAQ